MVKFWFLTQNDEDVLPFSHIRQALWNITLEKRTKIILNCTILCYPNNVRETTLCPPLVGDSPLPPPPPLSRYRHGLMSPNHLGTVSKIPWSQWSEIFFTSPLTPSPHPLRSEIPSYFWLHSMMVNTSMKPFFLKKWNSDHEIAYPLKIFHFIGFKVFFETVP